MLILSLLRLIYSLKVYKLSSFLVGVLYMVKGTRENIINAFFSLAAKYPDKYDFSIADIACEAGISRQAIYRNHFDNVNEIIKYIRHVIDDEVKAVMICYQKEENVAIYFAENVLPILYNRRQWLKLLYSSNIDPCWRRFLQKEYQPWFQNNLIFDPSKLNSNKEFISKLIINHTLAILEAWLSQDFPMPPEAFKKHFITLLSTPVLSFLE